MKKFEFPVAPGDVLEYESNGETVRGKVSFVTFSTHESYATIYKEDVFMKKCRDCTLSNCKKKKCKYLLPDGNDCKPTFAEHLEEIYANEIGYGKKYKIRSESWEFADEL